MFLELVIPHRHLPFQQSTPLHAPPLFLWHTNVTTDEFISRHLSRGRLLAELGHVLIRFAVDRGQSLSCAVKRDEVRLVEGGAGEERIGRAGEEREKSGRRAGEERIGSAVRVA
jgi:hypothetical protein